MATKSKRPKLGAGLAMLHEYTEVPPKAPSPVERVVVSVLANSGGPYAVLGLSAMATQEEVKGAHRSLASLLHPDRNPGNIGAAAAMAKVNEAYTLLTDAKAKAKHDLTAGLKKKCGACSGTGKTNRMKGFTVHKMKCLDCGGTGAHKPKLSRDVI